MQDKDLSQRVKISTMIHIGILLCIIVGPIIFRGRYRYNRPTIHTVQLVSLPSVRPQQAPAVTKPAKPAKTTATKAKPKPKAITKPIPKQITTPSLEEKLQKRLDTFDKEEFVEPESKPNVTPQLDIGISGPSNFAFQYYLDIIHDKISTSWHEPQMVLDKRYSAIVTFTILQDGSVQNIYIRKGSGVLNFDQSGQKAIELARPFPPLPQGYTHSQLTVNVAFNLE